MRQDALQGVGERRMPHVMKERAQANRLTKPNAIRSGQPPAPLEDAVKGPPREMHGPETVEIAIVGRPRKDHLRKSQLLHIA
jgi:hypothetical protein